MRKKITKSNGQNLISGLSISGLSIKQSVDGTGLLPNTEGKTALSDILRTYAEEKNELTLTLKFIMKICLMSTSFFKEEQMF